MMDALWAMGLANTMLPLGSLEDLGQSDYCAIALAESKSLLRKKP